MAGEGEAKSVTKHRICVSWFEGGEPKEKGFRVPYDDSWHKRIRAAELKAAAVADAAEGATVYSTSLDGETTDGFWLWDNSLQAYEYNELG